MAIIIKTDGTTKTVEPKNGKTFSLRELQEAVDGYIELISLDDGRLMIVDEEAKVKPGNKLNIEAARITGEVILGDVLIIDRDQIE